MVRYLRLKCKHPGCPDTYLHEGALARHESKPHGQCPKCGRHFVRVASHLGQMSRRGLDCTPAHEAGLTAGLV